MLAAWAPSATFWRGKKQDKQTKNIDVHFLAIEETLAFGTEVIIAVKQRGNASLNSCVISCNEVSVKVR